MNIEKEIAKTRRKAKELSFTEYIKWTIKRRKKNRPEGYEEDIRIYERILENFAKEP